MYNGGWVNNLPSLPRSASASWTEATFRSLFVRDVCRARNDWDCSQRNPSPRCWKPGPKPKVFPSWRVRLLFPGRVASLVGPQTYSFVCTNISHIVADRFKAWTEVEMDLLASTGGGSRGFIEEHHSVSRVLEEGYFWGLQISLPGVLFGTLTWPVSSPTHLTDAAALPCRVLERAVLEKKYTSYANCKWTAKS